MPMDDVRDEVRNFLLARFLPREDPADLADDTPLIAGGILDPSGVAELAAFLEGRFGIAVGPHEAGIPHLDSVEAIVRLVTSRWGREATPTIEPEGPPPPVPPPAVWGLWYEGDGGDPPGWSDLCLSEAEARKRLETCVLPGHRHRYRVAVAGVAPGRLAAAEAERDKLIVGCIKECWRPRTSRSDDRREHGWEWCYGVHGEFVATREEAIAAVRDAAGLRGHADAPG
jgi:acyl carrier protein